MRYSAHPERHTAFELCLMELDVRHGTIRPRSPWQNAFIERSHRTDNEELFHREQFTSSEQRRYRLKLWEFEYNVRRPHQGLGGKTPMEVYLAEYRMHAHCRMLT